MDSLRTRSLPVRSLLPRPSTSGSLALVLAAGLAGAATPTHGQTEVASVNRGGTASGNSSSGGTWFSANGRYVAFTSNAGDLVDDDVTGTDVFVRDLETGTTTLVSVNRFGTRGGNGQSLYPAISADGRFVAFESYASDLVENDANGRGDVFVRDMQAGTTTLVSVNSAGAGSGNGASSDAAISGDGRVVAFFSGASDLVGNDSNGPLGDVFARDLTTATTSLVSVNTEGGSGNRDSTGQRPVSLSADGRFLAFASAASDLVANDTNGGAFGGTLTDVFVRDLQAATTTLVSVNLSGGTGAQRSDLPYISADGRYVAFSSSVADIVSNDTNGTRTDVFVRDLLAMSTTLVSLNRTGTGSANDSSTVRKISPDARFVAFTSFASDIADVADSNAQQDVFVRDLQTGTTWLASVNHAGTGTGNGPSYNNSLDLSDDGRFVVFDARAEDLVANDANGDVDVFLRDLPAGATRLVSVNLAGTGTGDSHSYQPAITADGRLVGFTSAASDLVALPDANGAGTDVLLRAVNQRPVVSAEGPYAVDEGGTLSLVASASDYEGQALHFDWDLDQDGTFETPGQGASFPAEALDGPTSVTIVARATDEEGASGTGSAEVDVRNVAPTASFAAAPTSLIAGECSTLSFTSPFDPGTADTAAGFRHSFDCTDDGVFERDAASAASYRCRYTMAGNFVARASIADKDDGRSDYTLAVAVTSAQASVQQVVVDTIQGLVSTGNLSPFLGSLVTSVGQAAVGQIDAGNVPAAVALLRIARLQIQLLALFGRIPAATADQIIEGLDRIIRALLTGGTGPSCVAS